MDIAKRDEVMPSPLFISLLVFLPVGYLRISLAQPWNRCSAQMRAGLSHVHAM
jgi:hypothetical protein